MRRPLGPAELNEYSTPFDRFMERWGVRSVAMPAYMQHCAKPNYTYPNTDAVAYAMGFSAVPSARIVKHPVAALSSPTGRKQHPHMFLQYGWSIIPNKQIWLEVGDARFMASLHFIKENPSDPACLWHLDTLRLNGGRQGEYRLNCSVKGDTVLMRRILMCVQGTITRLERNDWEGAESIFHANLQSITSEIDDKAVRISHEPRKSRIA
ncbi:MAG: hypothetical protein KGQ41_06315 [Alphaproteobacteria bacterium]|nr:hypothetical protein [Alphaproteobacteria bacterium]